MAYSLFQTISELGISLTSRDLSGIQDLSSRHWIRKRNELEACMFPRAIWYVENGAMVEVDKTKASMFSVTTFYMPGSFMVNAPIGESLNENVLQWLASESATLVKIDYAQLLALSETSTALASLVIKLLEQRLMHTHFASKLIRMPLAEERYQALQDHLPEVLLHFAQKDISSFLGITSESYSRLKRKMVLLQYDKVKKATAA